MEMDQQYRTVLEESGRNLSSGQKQKLGLARLFLRKNVSLYLLDEITSVSYTHLEKKKADQRNIKFQIETQRIDSLPFSDIEIVSIFGNLLDNAIEACEKIEIEERWIHLLIKKQRHMFRCV